MICASVCLLFDILRPFRECEIILGDVRIQGAGQGKGGRKEGITRQHTGVAAEM
jgi:hypothetical protein